jgi:hypothetical protein
MNEERIYLNQLKTIKPKTVTDFLDGRIDSSDTKCLIVSTPDCPDKKCNMCKYSKEDQILIGEQLREDGFSLSYRGSSGPHQSRDRVFNDMHRNVRAVVEHINGRVKLIHTRS